MNKGESNRMKTFLAAMVLAAIVLIVMLIS